MRIDRFLLSLLATILLIYLLSRPFGSIPPLGKFLDPVNGFMANAEADEDFESLEKNFARFNVKGTIYFDDRLVPHIFAEDDFSLYFLQGYVHAKYRLWQMETQTRAASGRLSEVMGPALLNFDREKRRTGMVVGAENALEELKKDSAAYNCVLAYTKGVNEFLTGTSNSDEKLKLSYASLPLEYKLLNYRPEEWTPLKSMLLLKYMANTLTGYDDDVEYTNVIKKIGRKDFDLLFPDRPEGIDPIIPSEKEYDYKPAKIDTAKEYFEEEYYHKMAVKKTDNEGVGSNNWAVAPSKTKNGYAILCNDPHLQLNLPSLWYEIQLHSPSQNVYGASLPGAPGVIIGFNDSISWGVTNGGRDVRDWYKIVFRNDKRDEYRYNDGWSPVKKKVEVIKVKGEDDFIDTVLWTHQGPMVYTDFTEGKDSWNDLAMRWAAIDASNEFKTFYLLNRAKNYDDYRNALQHFSCPTQNFVFASHNGDIAITQQGKHAIKWPEQGRFVMDGSDPATDWQAYIPFDENPFIKNPLKGFVSSANQHPADSTYPYYYTGCDFEFFRNRRINERLTEMQNISAENMQNLQLDNFNYIASEALLVMMSKLSKKNNMRTLGDSSDKLSTYFDDWDFMNSPDNKTPSYFQIWWDTLYNLLWDEFYSEDMAFIKPDEYYTILAMKNLPDDYTYFDIQGTPKKETLTDVINLSYQATVLTIDSISNEDDTLLTWYRFKHTSILHIAQLPAFSKENVETGGYKHIVNATSGRHGPSWRMVVEMSSPITAYGVYPGGQSGNPGSKYYDNFIDDWAAGKYYPLRFFVSEEEAKQNTNYKITFK